MENVGRCPRCNKFMVAEEWDEHKCDFKDIPLTDCKSIILDHITDFGQDKNGDHVYRAWALDGVLYRLVVCKHNPPHSAKRKFTGCGTKQGLDSTSFEALLRWRLMP
jgi:hypothetical protein